VEAYDISNLGETYAVASMVVFEGGAPTKAHYRTFTMRDEAGQDDFARIREAVRRRFARLAAPGEDDPSFAARPGLVVIDGGRGQLSAALAGMREAGVQDVPVVSLAKRLEEVYRPGIPDPLLLPEGSAALRVLQHVRDEAHRFALRHHRGKRGRGMTESVLDALPGVGPARKAALLRHFGSAERFLAASREELASVPGVPAKVARDVYDHLHKTARPSDAPAAAEPEREAAWS
jgi:excinuclease ABC subunit C